MYLTSEATSVKPVEYKIDLIYIKHTPGCIPTVNDNYSAVADTGSTEHFMLVKPNL